MTLVINGKTYEVGELIAYVENLEKENAEMKEDNGKLNRKVELLKEELLNPKDKCYSKDKEQLTKAKVCLEQLVSEITVGELEVDPNILQQSENFLKEE